MAWIDDRIWCHPKLVGLTDHAFAAYIKSLAYASGMNTNGHLTVPQQKLIGADTRARRELLEARLWDINGDGETVAIHDWNEHNGARIARRERERERIRKARSEGKYR